ncbi:MAG: Rpn family recombination-promoting nuclease/putative transposase [Polyangiales bacterium]
MRPVFADPKTDFVFKKLFGTEDHKDLLIALLNALLGLAADRGIVDVTFLREEERPPVRELKFSVVDVKCRDARGTHFVVEMQVLNVEGFEKRVVYNASKAYVSQLGAGEDYPSLDDIVAVSICDFTLWPDAPGEARVPLVSHWRMVEQGGGRRGLGQVQYVFVELPKLPLDRPPGDESEEWAYVFRRAATLREVPSFLRAPGPRRALDVARTAHFTEAEWDFYDRAKVAEQDARGALSLVHRQGVDEGTLAGLRAALRAVVTARGWTLTEAQAALVDACENAATLERWLTRAVAATGLDEVFERA